MAGANAAATKAVTAVVSGAAHTVYRSVTAGKAYFGITNDIARRGSEHSRGLGIEIEPILTNLSKADARAVEQVLIQARGLKKDGGDLLNQINSVSPRRKDFEKVLSRGREILAKFGIDPANQ